MSTTRASGGGGASAPELVQLVLRVEQLHRQQVQRDEIENEAEDRIHLGRKTCLPLCLLKALERAIPGDERRHDDRPTDRDYEDRGDGADVDPRRIAQLPVDLVVPDDV